MDIFFQDPDEIPLPPDEVRIRELRAEPWPDGRRVRIYLEVDPFQKRPSAELVIRDANEQVVANASVIESMTRRIELTLHLRGEIHTGSYLLTATLFFLAPPPEPGGQPGSDLTGEAAVVDRKQITFPLIRAEN